MLEFYTTFALFLLYCMPNFNGCTLIFLSQIDLSLIYVYIYFNGCIFPWVFTHLTASYCLQSNKAKALFSLYHLSIGMETSNIRPTWLKNASRTTERNLDWNLTESQSDDNPSTIRILFYFLIYGLLNEGLDKWGPQNWQLYCNARYAFNTTKGKESYI